MPSLNPVRTVVVGEHAELHGWLERRHALRQDKADEVWEGVYHVAPHEHPRHGVVAMSLTALLHPLARAAGLIPGGSFNLGTSRQNFRVPDLGYYRQFVDEVYVPSAAVVVEILSPGDETFEKFDFYAARGVEEVWVLDPDARTARCWHLVDGSLVERDRSKLLDLTMDDVVAGVDWV